MKHIHAELIKAWADGAEIEWFDKDEKEWHPIVNPSWSTNSKYRVKVSLGRVAHSAFYQKLNPDNPNNLVDKAWNASDPRFKEAWEAAAQAVIEAAKDSQ